MKMKTLLLVCSLLGPTMTLADLGSGSHGGDVIVQRILLAREFALRILDRTHHPKVTGPTRLIMKGVLSQSPIFSEYGEKVTVVNDHGVPEEVSAKFDERTGRVTFNKSLCLAQQLTLTDAVMLYLHEAGHAAGLSTSEVIKRADLKDDIGYQLLVEELARPDRLLEKEAATKPASPDVLGALELGSLPGKLGSASGTTFHFAPARPVIVPVGYDTLCFSDHGLLPCATPTAYHSVECGRTQVCNVPNQEEEVCYLHLGEGDINVERQIAALPVDIEAIGLVRIYIDRQYGAVVYHDQETRYRPSEQPERIRKRYEIRLQSKLFPKIECLTRYSAWFEESSLTESSSFYAQTISISNFQKKLEGVFNVTFPPPAVISPGASLGEPGASDWSGFDFKKGDELQLRDHAIVVPAGADGASVQYFTAWDRFDYSGVGCTFLVDKSSSIRQIPAGSRFKILSVELVGNRAQPKVIAGESLKMSVRSTDAPFVTAVLCAQQDPNSDFRYPRAEAPSAAAVGCLVTKLGTARECAVPRPASLDADATPDGTAYYGFVDGNDSTIHPRGGGT